MIEDKSGSGIAAIAAVTSASVAKPVAELAKFARSRALLIDTPYDNPYRAIEPVIVPAAG